MSRTIGQIGSATTEIARCVDSLKFREEMLDRALGRLELYMMGFTVFVALVSIAIAIVVWRSSLLGSRAVAAEYFKDQGRSLVEEVMKDYDRRFADEVRKFHDLGTRTRGDGTTYGGAGPLRASSTKPEK